MNFAHVFAEKQQAITALVLEILGSPHWALSGERQEKALVWVIYRCVGKRFPETYVKMSMMNQLIASMSRNIRKYTGRWIISGDVQGQQGRWNYIMEALSGVTLAFLEGLTKTQYIQDVVLIEC